MMVARVLRRASDPRWQTILAVTPPRAMGTVKDWEGFEQTAQSNTLVFGPASDGGFWLIGAKGPVAPDIFDNVAWSTETAMSDIERNVKGDIAYLRTLTDIDDIEALRDYRRGERSRI